MPRVDLSFERTVLDGLGRLLLDDTDIESAASALRGVRHRIHELPPVAYKHKITTIMSYNARLLKRQQDEDIAALSDQLERLLESDMAQALAHRRLLEQELARLVGTLGISATIIKGFSAARLYPSPYVRWMRDIDLLTARWEDALALLETLLQQGYIYDEQESPWLKADPARGRGLYGQFFLVKPEGDDFSRIDIHYGTYSAGYSGYLEIDLQKETKIAKFGHLNIRVPKPEGCLLIAQAHALSDGYVAIKDINDFVAITISNESVDWSAVGAAIRWHKLTPQMSLLAEHVLALYTDPRVVSSATTLLQTLGGRRRSIWQTHNRSWRLRAAVNTSFTFRWQLSKGDRVVRSGIRAAQCYLFYIRRLQLAVRPRKIREKVLRRLMAEPDLARWRLRPDACTLLIDATVVGRLAGTGSKTTAAAFQTSVFEEGIDVLCDRRYQYLRVKNRTFVPTLDLIIPPGQAAALPNPR